MENNLNKLPKNVKKMLWKSVKGDDSKDKDELFHTIAMYWMEKQQMFNNQIKSIK